MKISRDGTFYVQLIDLIFFSQPQFKAPENLMEVLNVALYNEDTSRHDFIPIRDSSSIEFLSSAQCLDDLDEINKLSKQEIDKKLAALTEEARHNKRTSDDESYVKFISIIYQILRLNDYIQFRKGAANWRLPNRMESSFCTKRKKKESIIRDYFEFI